MSPTLIDLAFRAIFIATLLYLAFVDLRTFRLPNVLTYPFLVAGLLINCLTNSPITTPQEALFGAPLGYLLIWLPNSLYRYIQRKDGIGMGDAKVLAALGAWLGWSNLPAILLMASLFGVLGGVLWLKLKQRQYGEAFPFGPFLAIAGIIQLLWPQFHHVLPPISVI